MLPYNTHNRRLVEVALGNRPADLIIRDGLLVDVYSARTIPHRSVAVSGRWIAYVGPDASHTLGEGTQIIEAEGRAIVPGYIDPHTHIANYWNVADFLEYAIPGGTTTFVTEVESYGFALGAEGFRAFLEQVRGRPVKIFCLIPPLVTVSPAVRPLYISPEETEELLKDPNVIGLGESYWQNAILTPDDRVLDLIRVTARAGGSVQGHGAGARDRRLAAYAAAGALSCHESVSPEDILGRLEMGYEVMLREGYVRRDLESLRTVKDEIDLRRVSLCTDGANPAFLLERGYMHDVVRKTIDMGVDPVRAIQMATINPAEHLGLSRVTGGVSPGRFADILLLPEPGLTMPDIVISEGRVVAEKGKTTVPLAQIPYPDSLLHTVDIPPLRTGDLDLPLSAASPDREVRTMDIQANGLVTRPGRAKIREGEDVILPDPERDLLKIAFIDRVSGRGQRFVGFVRGWGQKRGAVATSLSWDASGIVAIGANDRDLERAVNRVIELQGGMVLSLDGELLVDIRARIGGYVWEKRVEEIHAELKHFQKTVTDLGSGLADAQLTLVTLTSASIPFVRITEKGYFRFRENDYVGLSL
jgi:adenine deaminase